MRFDRFRPAGVSIGFEEIPRVMWPVAEVHADESLMGAAFRTSAENIQECTAPILDSAGLPHHRAYNLSTRPDLDESRLAHVLRLPISEIRIRRYDPIEIASGPPLASFFETPIALYDLQLRTRLLAPLRLQSDAYHRAVWQHGLLPFDLVTAEWLVDTCPRCSRKQAWYQSAGVSICDDPRCRFDFRESEAACLDHELFARAAPVGQLLDPRPAVHGPALAILPQAVRALGRGTAFELIWRLGRATVHGHAVGRDEHKSLPKKEIVDAICAGADLVAEWPERLEFRIRQLATSGDDRGATAFVRAVRRIGHDRLGWPAHRAFFDASVRNLLSTDRKAYLNATDDGVDGADARRILRVSTNTLVQARDKLLVKTAAAGGKTNVHAVFSRTQLERIRSGLDDRMPGGALAEKLGVSRHGVEQLVCLGEIAESEEGFVRDLYSGLQLSSRSVERMFEDLEGQADKDIGNALDSVSLRRALMLIGGREKPWGPILQALRNGSLQFGLCNGRTFSARVKVQRTDIAAIAGMGFDRASYQFDFSAGASRRDAQETLNLTPVLMMSALRDELQATASEKRVLRLDQILRIARQRISGGEILARWGSGRRMPRQLRDKRRFRRFGATGWDRQTVECAMLEAAMMSSTICGSKQQNANFKF